MLIFLSAALAGPVDQLDASALSVEAQPLLDLEPIPNRAGFLVLAGPALRAEDAPEALAWRLAHIDEDADSREAVARQLAIAARTHGELIDELVRAEQDEGVAAHLLNGLRTRPESAPLVVGFTTSDDAEIRLEAVRVLGHYEGSEVAGQALVAALSDEDELVRALAARNLGYIGYTPATTDLEGLASDSSDAVRKSATRSLERLR
ncbi:MAG: HEAT repeat domain-containing protein [Proteobacteria bacterium]|nr:HEAT repeat domain-containing protein [Pseudomonadota bacterium]MCP4919171.1 HEAT repeat domain-containing protein [Pseudomonadota bacterium]